LHSGVTNYIFCVSLIANCGTSQKPQQETPQKQQSKEDLLKVHTKNTIFSFLGAPGSGKGTVATDCVNSLGFKVLSTGNLCRERIACGDKLGKAIEKYVNSGQLIPDQMITDMVEDWLKKETVHGNPIILDGYPRSKKQAELFLALLKKSVPHYSFRVVAFVISDEEIVKRLSNRLLCENKACQAPTSKFMVANIKNPTCARCGGKLIRRDDDKEEVVRERLRVYAQHSSELVHYYQELDQKIEELNVSGLRVPQVFEAFKKLLE